MLYIQKKTFDLIRSVDCDFLSQVKGNTPALLESIQLFTGLTTPCSTCEYYQENNGVQITRYVELYYNIIDLPKGWKDIQQFVKVRRYGYRNSKRFEETSYYVSSKNFSSAVQAALAIQGHWSVENKLHWLKDVSYKPIKATFAKIANKVKELYKLFTF